MAMGFAGGNRGGNAGGNASQMDRGGQSSDNAAANRGKRTPVWIMGEDKLLRPVILKLGLSDGVQTEIVEGKLKEGDKVILSTEIAGNRSAGPAQQTRAPGFGGPMGGMRR
jgi:HlyD family secretion protein